VCAGDCTSAEESPETAAPDGIHSGSVDEVPDVNRYHMQRELYLCDDCQSSVAATRQQTLGVRMSNAISLYSC
jgi:hypothetical protein